MSFDPGTLPGPYLILSPLGAGGVGEVVVAVKVLRAERRVDGTLDRFARLAVSRAAMSSDIVLCSGLQRLRTATAGPAAD